VTACAAAGVRDVLFQDLRRTALTNIIEAWLSEKEAMEDSGHKTRNVFNRYHIVSERRTKQNTEKIEEHLKSKEVCVEITGKTGKTKQASEPKSFEMMVSRAGLEPKEGLDRI
jgi:hypothetical protein